MTVKTNQNRPAVGISRGYHGAQWGREAVREQPGRGASSSTVRRVMTAKTNQNRPAVSISRGYQGAQWGREAVRG